MAWSATFVGLSNKRCFRGPGTARKAVWCRDTGAPISTEMATRELTRLPHRSLCAACVSGSSQRREHKRLDAKDFTQCPV